MRTLWNAIVVSSLLVGCGAGDREPGGEAGSAGMTGGAAGVGGTGATSGTGGEAATGGTGGVGGAGGVGGMGGAAGVGGRPLPPERMLHPGSCVSHVDYGADGTIEDVTTSMYDEMGQALRRDTVHDSGETSLEASMWDAGGNRTELRIEHTSGSPFLLLVQTATYNSAGKILTYREEVDGVVTSNYALTYDDNGEEVRYESDRNEDGVADQVTTTTREPYLNGVRATRQSTSGLVVIEVLDAAGNIIEQRTDMTGDGTFENVILVTYDDSGYKVMSTTDAGDDGVIDARRTYTNDAYGSPLHKTVDLGDDGIPDEITDWEYDIYGNTLSERVDLDADGTYDRRSEWTYNSYGSALTERFDPDVPNQFVHFTEWEYDSDGNITRISRDVEDDGVFDTVHTYDYSCW